MCSNRLAHKQVICALRASKSSRLHLQVRGSHWAQRRAVIAPPPLQRHIRRGAGSAAQICGAARRRMARAGAAASGVGPCAAAHPPEGVLQVARVPALGSNYIWLLREPRSGAVAAVDPGDAAAVSAELAARGWQLDFILTTHHHADHVGGNAALRAAFPQLQVVGPAADAARIPGGVDIPLADGATWQLGALEVRALHTPGHTRGHMCYWLPAAGALFSGDTLFTCGCGMLFEGDPQTMWASLSRLAALPPDTRVYCAHEYTQANAAFALTVNPGNAALQQRKAAVDAARARGEPTVPSLLSLELATNPMLRPDDAEIRASVGLPAGAEDWRVFGAVRAAKDGRGGRVMRAVYPLWDRLPLAAAVAIAKFL